VRLGRRRLRRVRRGGLQVREQRRLIRGPVVARRALPTQQRVHRLLQLGDALLLAFEGLAQLRDQGVQHAEVVRQRRCCSVRLPPTLKLVQGNALDGDANAAVHGLLIDDHGDRGSARRNRQVGGVRAHLR
jgi:hypothetical protein